MHKRLPCILILLCLLLISPVAAQQDAPTDAFPTVDALNNTEVPAADSVLLAQRLRGVTDTSVTPRPQPEIGTVEPFTVINSAQARTFTVDARLIVMGEHVYMWVEDGVEVSESGLQDLATGFDERVYDQVRDLWGPEPNPGVDGDPRVHVLFVRGLGPGTGAYYARRHRFPQSVYTTSNEREMFFVNLDAFSTINAAALESTLAHEFQHMIRDNIDVNQATWLNEGFSTFTEAALGHDSNLQWLAGAFLAAPGTQLNTFGGAGSSNRAVNYGAGFLFVNYFYDRYGEDGVRALSAQTLNGLAGVQATLADLDGSTVDDFFADWVVANWVQSAEEGYGYTSYDPLIEPPAQAFINSTRYLNTASVGQYGTDYYRIDPPENVNTLTVTLVQDETIGLADTMPFSGAQAWYSNRADVSHSTLTNTFDLSVVDAATLTYHAWWEIEEGWDYLYLTASGDGGQTWDILAAPGTTTDNPHGNAYGPGYSGTSAGWVQQTVSLDEYAGGEVTLRFELITDDAVTEAGFLLDDLAIAEIDYFSDFEVDGGGWQSAGWVRTDNRLPQRAWVQVIQTTAAGVELTRWLADTPEATFSVPLAPDVSEIALAISPFAPLTTVPATYSIDVAME